VRFFRWRFGQGRTVRASSVDDIVDLLAGLVVAGEVLGRSTLSASRFFPPVTGFVGGLLAQ